MPPPANVFALQTQNIKWLKKPGKSFDFNYEFLPKIVSRTKELLRDFVNCGWIRFFLFKKKNKATEKFIKFLNFNSVGKIGGKEKKI